jgi:hypothetical protein
MREQATFFFHCWGLRILALCIGEIAVDLNNRRAWESKNNAPWDAQAVVSLIKHDALIRRLAPIITAQSANIP